MLSSRFAGVHVVSELLKDVNFLLFCASSRMFSEKKCCKGHPGPCLASKPTVPIELNKDRSLRVKHLYQSVFAGVIAALPQ